MICPVCAEALFGAKVTVINALLIALTVRLAGDTENTGSSETKDVISSGASPGFEIVSVSPVRHPICTGAKFIPVRERTKIGSTGRYLIVAIAEPPVGDPEIPKPEEPETMTFPEASTAIPAASSLAEELPSYRINHFRTPSESYRMVA